MVWNWDSEGNGILTKAFNCVCAHEKLSLCLVFCPQSLCLFPCVE